MRAVDYTATALKDLRRQPVRSGLTVIALVISTVILVMMAAISLGGQRAISSQFGSDDSLASITVTPNQGGGALSPFGSVQQANSAAAKLDDAAVARLRELPHVQTASPQAYVWELDTFQLDGDGKRFVTQAAGVPGDAWLPLEAGTRFTSDDDKNAVIIGHAYAEELGLSPQALIGKFIRITTQKGYRGAGADIPAAGASPQENDAFNQRRTTLSARVVGVTKSGPDENRLFIPLGWARDIRTARYAEAGGTKAVDQVEKDGYAAVRIKVDSQSNVKGVANSISQLGYGQVSALTQLEHLQQFSATMWLILGAVAVIAVVAAALGVVNTMLMAVSEQRHTIGVWRACGARRGFIVKLFLLEAAMLGLVGGSLGAGLGIFASGFVNQYVNSLLRAQGLALSDIAVTPWWLVAGTVALTTSFGVIAGLYPAYRAAREDPSRTLGSGQ